MALRHEVERAPGWSCARCAARPSRSPSSARSCRGRRSRSSIRRGSTTASMMRPIDASTDSTARIAASSLPVCPTMSVFAKFTTMTSCFALASASTTRSVTRGRAHLGLEVVGRDLRRRDEDALLALERLLAAAVEEERHVRVLLGLGDPELAHPERLHDLAEDLVERDRAEQHREREVRAVLGHRHEERDRASRSGTRRSPRRRSAPSRAGARGPSGS